jgi:antirestriction protein
MTNKIEIYVANLGKYNEGILKGEWFTLPADLDEIRVKIGVAHYDEKNNFVPYVIETDEKGNEYIYEEWAIHDYIAPFEIGEYANIEELNEIAEKISDMNDYEINALKELLDQGYDFEESLEMIEDGEVRFYFDCNDMEDVAYVIVEECGYLNQIPEHLQNYFDYDAFGRDIEIEGNFVKLDGSVYMEICR